MINLQKRKFLKFWISFKKNQKVLKVWIAAKKEYKKYSQKTLNKYNKNKKLRK